MIKREARVLGIDDAPFNKFKDKDVLVVGTVFRGGHLMDGVLSTRVAVDGTDATQKLIEMINRSKFKLQFRAVFLKGIALGGFNVVDLNELHRATGIPIIVTVRSYPNFKEIFATLKKIGMEAKINLIKSFPKPEKFGKIWVQYIGLPREKAFELLKLTCIHAEIPEPIRAAHLIAAGVVKGESRGRV